MINKNLPQLIKVFPLSNFIIFPQTTVPLNIFEPRYIAMINDSMKTDKLIGIVQTKSVHKKYQKSPLPIYNIGCLGKITSFKETDDGRYLIDLKGIIRFKILKEITDNKPYRSCEVNFDNYLNDLSEKKENLKFSDLELIFKNLRQLFEKRGFIINWKALEKQSLDETINALAMASPFSLEEKQVLLEAVNLDLRKNKIAEILSTYTFDEYNNTTLQ
jgi:Lon protease-like protein